MDLGAGGKPPSRRADEPAGVCGQSTVSQGQASLSWPAPRALEGVPASQPHCGARPGWGTPTTQQASLAPHRRRRVEKVVVKNNK